MKLKALAGTFYVIMAGKWPRLINRHKKCYVHLQHKFVQ